MPDEFNDHGYGLLYPFCETFSPGFVRRLDFNDNDILGKLFEIS
jgi:hypothetical protein